jgi:hypothetical protein
MTKTNEDWSLDPVDTTAVGIPPAVTFYIEEGVIHSRPLPYDYSITISKLQNDAAGRLRSNVILKRGEEIYAQAVFTHHPHRDLSWEQPALYAAESACALFWASWRMEEYRRLLEG